MLCIQPKAASDLPTDGLKGGKVKVFDWWGHNGLLNVWSSRRMEPPQKWKIVYSLVICSYLEPPQNPRSAIEYWNNLEPNRSTQNNSGAT